MRMAATALLTAVVAVVLVGSILIVPSLLLLLLRPPLRQRAHDPKEAVSTHPSPAAPKPSVLRERPPPLPTPCEGRDLIITTLFMTSTKRSVDHNFRLLQLFAKSLLKVSLPPSDDEGEAQGIRLLVLVTNDVPAEVDARIRAISPHIAIKRVTRINQPVGHESLNPAYTGTPSKFHLWSPSLVTEITTTTNATSTSSTSTITTTSTGTNATDATRSVHVAFFDLDHFFAKDPRIHICNECPPSAKLCATQDLGHQNGRRFFRDGYFNSGFLVIKPSLETYNLLLSKGVGMTGDVNFGEQDALNVLFRGQWQALSKALSVQIVSGYLAPERSKGKAFTYTVKPSDVVAYHYQTNTEAVKQLARAMGVW